MIINDLSTLSSMSLPDIPTGFIERGSFRREAKNIPLGSIVCIQKTYYDAMRSNPECVWGYVRRVDGDTIYTSWLNGTKTAT